MDAQDETLAKAVAGDKDALCVLLEAHGPAIEAGLNIATAWHRTLDRADVMQVTYLDAFTAIRRFDVTRSDSFPAWLRRLAENNLKDAIRGLEAQKKPPARKQVIQGQNSAIALVELLSATDGTPSRAIRREEAEDQLRRALRCLPPDYAQVVELYDLSGNHVDRVAKVLQRSPGAVFMLRARAHERLREILGSASQFFESRP